MKKCTNENIERLPKDVREKCIEQGIELGLFYYNEICWMERIKLADNRFVAYCDSDDYLNKKDSAVYYCSITSPWFDIPKPKMRDMTPREMAIFCRDRNYIPKSKANGSLESYGVIEIIDLVKTSYYYIDENGDEQQFKQVEDK